MSDSTTPRDAKVISAILRSLGIEECEPRVLIQLLEYSCKYSSDILNDAKLYSLYRNKDDQSKTDQNKIEQPRITIEDVKIALQTKIGRYFVPPPPRDYINEISNNINSRNLTPADSDTVLSMPPSKIALFNLEYEIIKKDTEKKRRVY